ncbi:MAG: arginine decarboxylase [Saprospiraceae bacterium]
MKHSYFDLVDQTFYFPQEGFQLEDHHLTFYGIDLYDMLERYGTPLKISYLPKISDQIRKARKWFDKAFKEVGYQGKYYYCYVTKSSHFKFVLDEVLKAKTHLETSSSFDIDLVRRLILEGKVSKDTFILNNGFKTREYAQKISSLINEGYTHVIPVLDNMEELDYYDQFCIRDEIQIGIRLATEEEPNFEFYTSRLGIRSSELLSYYKHKIAVNPRFKVKLLHFFVDTGMKDDIYYWSELRKGIKTYCQLKKVCPELTAINIGGGMPIRNSLSFDFDYQYMISEIVRLIKQSCDEEEIPEPDIFTEFGKYTVGESGATFFSVIGQKQQNDSELWYMVDNSLMNTLPDSWGINERFILLPVNLWEREAQRVNIGGLSCDNADYYNSEAHANQVYLPKIRKGEKLYLGFFHTGAYQDALSGYGGIKHCLIPSPQHVLVDRDKEGNLVEIKIAEQQTPESMLKILGYLPETT